MKVGTDVRRQVFLIFKESINNAVRHSGCTEAEIDFKIEKDRLTLRVSDNGKGLGLNSDGDGHGLMSMRERARELGGTLNLTSNNGKGTTLLLHVPMDVRRFRWWRASPPK
jgi:signal transduction histidine kinase